MQLHNILMHFFSYVFEPRSRRRTMGCIAKTQSFVASCN